MPGEALAARPGPWPEWIGEYEVIGELGRGTMSTVYRAVRGGTEYAVKVMGGSASTDALDMRLQFRREAAAVARLDHPSLVKVLEAGEHEGLPYLVMEIARGEGLDHRVARGVLPEGEVVRLGRSVAAALVEVHRYGLVHRDVKPSNIVLADDGSATLIDFGMVTEVTDTDEIAGTLYYAPPEQVGALNRAVDSPADLYALGATLFECLTGRPPFDGDTQADLLHKVATVRPPLVTDLRPEIRPALALVVDRLLRKDPDDRYQTASGLAADLGNLAALDEALRSGGELSLRTHDGPALGAADTPLVGRAEHLASLEAAWERARSGDATFVQITGEGGSGKTRLAQQLLAQGAAEGALILAGKCQENEITPFGPLREAADRHVADLRRLPEPARSEATERIRRAAGASAPLVRRLSPGLGRLLGDTGEIRALDPGAEQQRYYQALASFFASLGTPESPLVLVIDDVQWLDAGSSQVLSVMADARSATPMLVISTCRPTDSAITHSFLDAVAHRAAPPITLEPLSRAHVGELIASRLGGRSVEDATTDRLAELTHGNPYAVGEYLRALLDRGILRPTTDGWAADMSEVDSVRLPDDVVELVIERIKDLDEATSRLVQVAAITGGRFTAGLLSAVSGMTLEVVQRGLVEMSRAGLVGPSFDDTWSFHHDRAREAITDRVSEERRRDLHQAIAEALHDGEDRSPATLYALARHCARGHVELAPERVATANLEAGLAALDEHAYENAFEMLDIALASARTAGMLDALAGTLLPAVGRACAMTGRLEQAFEHLDAALPHATTREERFQIHHLLTLTYASQGRNDEALAALFRSFDVIGRPFPKTRVMQIAQLLLTWVLAIVLRRTGIGHGKARGRIRDRRRIQSQLNYAGTMIALFQGDTLLMVQFIVRDFYNVHFLGPAAETAIASAVYGAVLGTFRLRSVMQHHTSAGVAMAEQLGDRAALAVCNAYRAVGHKWAGELDVGNEMMVEALPQLRRFVPGSWYSAMMIGEQAYSYLQAGRARAAHEHIQEYRAELNRTNNLMFRYNMFSVEYCVTLLCGDPKRASAMWDELEQQWPALSETAYVRLAKSVAQLEVMVDRVEVGPEVERAIQVYGPVQGEDYYSHNYRFLVGYARLHELEHGPEADRPAARRRLKRAILALRLRAMVPLFAVHPHIWSAALARLDGRLGPAERHLRKAEALARRLHFPRADYHIAIERARLAEARGDSTAVSFARTALDVAISEGWNHKAQLVRGWFGLREERPAVDFAQTRAGTTAISRSADQAQRYADALLQVSLASASTLDSDEQARQALDAVARVLGAERALFFLLEGDELVLKATTVGDAESISRTVVRRVVETRQPIVLTGDDTGTEVMLSESILTHGLRSIMAAPLLLRDRMIGVVYLDSRLAKGIFTADDVSVLLGVCNHIAIAVETARSARLDAERSVMQKDLELVGAVQSLMLPASSEVAVEGARGHGFYQSAAQCGGDWWWSETCRDGSLILWLGDVSGHGAAPAMITSSVAGAFHTLRALDAEAPPDRILAQLNCRVAALGGQFHMTMTAVRIDPVGGRVYLWNAGGPAVFLLTADGLRTLTAPGGVLGQSDELAIGMLEAEFGPGDRLFMCTDGVLELQRPNGRQLGARGLAHLLQGAADTPIDRVPADLARALNEALAGRPQDDDITFIVAEST